MADCNTRDRACRIAAIGPFLVDGGPRPASSERAAMLALAIPAMSAAGREELAQSYDALKEHKALAIVPGTRSNWRSWGWATSEAAEEGTLERCQVFHGIPCALALIDDQLRPVPSDGKWPTREMTRVRYAGTFDPERIPGVLPSLRARSDVVRYREASGPKAAAYHPWGRVFIVLSAENQRAAEALALSNCNADPDRQGRDGPCHLYATGDQVVLSQRLTQPSTP